MTDTNTHGVGYVRGEMLPEKSPPVGQKGAIKWMRENLFSSWLNIALTVISLYVVYLALALVLPWAFGGVWNAGSLTECREVLFSFYKDSHDGACWAVIEDRWLQLLFGFYPPEEYWRPVLAFVLLFVALAPVLFAEKVPGQMMWFSLAYPFLAVWLIWGGSFWTPLFVAFGFVVGFIALKFLSKITGPIVANLLALAAALIWWGAIMSPLSDGLHKAIGAGRLDATLSTLETRTAELPAEIAALEAEGEEKTAEIAVALEEKNATVIEMAGIRVGEFAIEQQIEPKTAAFDQLNAAQESISDLSDILAEWGGAPTAASDSEAAVAEAERAASSADTLVGNIGSLLTGALSDLEEDTADLNEVSEIMVASAAEKDASILDDVASMVDKAELIEPLAGLIERAEGVSTATSVSDLGALRADVETAMAGLSANIASLDTIREKIVATNVAGLEEPQARLLSQMQGLTALRNDESNISQAAFRASTESSESGSFMSALTSLEEREASLPELRASVDTAREALPRAYRNMINVNQLPEDASREDRAALADYIEANSQELSVAGSVRETYAELGRVGLKPVASREIGGFTLAIIIGVAGIVLSLPLGILLALGRQSHLFFVNKVCVTFIEVIRGVPLIVWLITASLLLNYFLPPGSNFDLMLRVIIMVTLFASAYIAEVIRGGLAALPTGQYEGADSLGLSYWQSMQLIVLPQAMKISIPGIVNTFIGLFKDTVLVVFIGLFDPIGLAGAIRADTDWNGIYWELFVFIGVIFFIFCFSMGRYSLYLEKKLQREHR
ncbi:general L-amino acid transport system permease protein [Octadecabacter temperatus]|uniref:Inner membrane amino-acid ABC transporter permease protein YhdY n=1 Tax=Octadecabacter temperatus TaxID=1458307 RepID=A0A0K0Y1U8_9RHOB|nr:Inner membrane amino-acid ABC transporter permease protein YhdY [Octadecabacter temperatus]SIO34118.1 general L-amino acid transport system permease protein [Octadecabacter temperatus]